MNTMTKKGTLLMLAVLTLVMSIFVPLNKTSAATMYNNTTTASISTTVKSGGVLSVSLSVVGIKSKTTRIGTELYVEKKLILGIWIPVAIGCPNNVWTDSVNNFYYSNIFATQLSATGTYRVTVTYSVSGSGGVDDIITCTDTVTY